ncbi:MAG: sodium:solute symporter [Prevotellaceae bacterium]|nr:sodium:solute symporter [Prevotellaceae bacterium]
MLLISRLTSRKGNSNADFFNASRNSKWYVVAFGMIGSSVSGISLVSVPGMVINSGFTYLQMCFGFIVGYIVVATVLLPLYYKKNLTSIYGYLNERFGSGTQKTGAWFFIVSKIITSASKLYVAVLVLQQFLFSQWNIPVWLTIIICVSVIYLYTFSGGIKTIVFTDALQSLILFLVIILMLFNIISLLDFSLLDTVKALNNSELSNTFVFSDFVSSKNFFKQFFSGIFIVIVMTGLSQDMMQTTLSCKNLKEAQKNMFFYGTGFVPLNFLLLALGALIVIFAQKNGILLPEKADNIVPMFASTIFSPVVCALFIIGIIAATFNSADGALTGIATTFFVDILTPTQPSNLPPAPSKMEENYLPPPPSKMEGECGASQTRTLLAGLGSPSPLGRDGVGFLASQIRTSLAARHTHTSKSQENPNLPSLTEVDILTPPQPTPKGRENPNLQISTKFEMPHTPPPFWRGLGGGLGSDIALRKLVYFLVCLVFVVVILLFDNIKNNSILDTIYTIVGYAYGPLLGLFAFGLFTKWQVKEKLIPILAIFSPILTFFISFFAATLFNYNFGYELLLINGLSMFLMMLFIKK